MAKPEPQTKLTSGDLLKLLAERHAEDLFVPECKNGPTHTASQLRKLDAWAMRKSWVQFSTIGYEIKVSRQDFERDQKWVEYLDLCHEFYFVCPTGLIKATELPKGVGLIWASANGSRLQAKTKATKREPNPDTLRDLLVYVLMCRAKIEGERGEQRAFRGEGDAYREFIAQAEKRNELALFVSAHIREQFRLQEERMTKMGRRAKAADDLFAKLEALGIKQPEGDWPDTWRMSREIDALVGKIPDGFERRVRQVGEGLQDLLKTLDELRAPKRRGEAA